MVCKWSAVAAASKALITSNVVSPAPRLQVPVMYDVLGCIRRCLGEAKRCREALLLGRENHGWMCVGLSLQIAHSECCCVAC